MLVDDLSATPSHKQDREVVELSDLALELDSIDEKHRHIQFVVAQMLEEGVLDRCSRLCGHTVPLLPASSAGSLFVVLSSTRMIFNQAIRHVQ